MSNVKIPAFAETASRRQANDKGMSKPKIKMSKRPRNRKIYCLTYVYPVRKPRHLRGNDINKASIPYTEAGGKVPFFLTGFTLDTLVFGLWI